MPALREEVELAPAVRDGAADQPLALEVALGRVDDVEPRIERRAEERLDRLEARPLVADLRPAEAEGETESPVFPSVRALHGGESTSGLPGCPRRTGTLPRLMRQLLKKTAPLAVLAFLLALPLHLVAGAPAEAMDAAGIRLALKKLNVVGGVLYVAAHPDDENTAFLAWGSKGALVSTAYLAITRGDGGQNLIGTESAGLLGLLRTQELLAARRIDGAQQFFTRAIDFGYSKSPDETLAIWDREKVLSDVVRVIRTFRPDVVVNRFPTTGEGGHGHHTASAILSVEAFEAAGDPGRFPDQIAEGLRPWKPRRLYFNAFRFRPDQPRVAPEGSLAVDLGAYNALLGRSYTEIAAQARTMHKSQGFGSAERRGSFLNDFVLLKGERAGNDLFDGIDLTWKRVPGGESVAPLLAEAERTFREDDPAASLPILLKTWEKLNALPPGPEKDVKRDELLEVIRSCAGIWIEAVAADPAAVPGGSVKVSTMILNRSRFPMTLASVDVTGAPAGSGGEMRFNEPLRTDVTMALPADQPLTNPYWLRLAAGKGSLRGRERLAHRQARGTAPVRRAFPRPRRRRDSRLFDPGRLPPDRPRPGRDLSPLRRRSPGDRELRREGLRLRGRRREDDHALSPELHEGQRNAPARRERGLEGLPGRGPLLLRGARRGEEPRIHGHAAGETVGRDLPRDRRRRRKGVVAKPRPDRLPAHSAADALPAGRGEGAPPRPRRSPPRDRLHHGAGRHGARGPPADRVQGDAPLGRGSGGRRPLPFRDDRRRDPRLQHETAAAGLSIRISFRTSKRGAPSSSSTTRPASW